VEFARRAVGRSLRSLILSVRKPGVEENGAAVDDLSQSIFANARYSAGSPRMRKQKLLQRLVAALATNERVQPKRTEIWQRLKSLTPREVDVLCYVLGGQLNREIAAELGITERTIKVHRGHVMEKLGVQSTAQLFPMVLRVLRESRCKILEDIKELGRETAASNRRRRNQTDRARAVENRVAAPTVALRRLCPFDCGNRSCYYVIWPLVHRSRSARLRFASILLLRPNRAAR